LQLSPLHRLIRFSEDAFKICFRHSIEASELISELASKSGIAQTTISQIEQDNRKPSSKNLKKICEALNIPEELIFLYAFESIDVPEKNKILFKKMFPPFKEISKRCSHHLRK
jgi:transcriptional regulator with XRE-family HTH domain